MLRCVILQVTPKVICKGIFRIWIRLQNTNKLWSLFRELGKLKVAPLAKSNEEDSFSMLRNNRLCIDYLVVNCVSKMLGKSVMDDLKCFPFVVPLKILHILENKGGRPMKVEDVCDGKKEIALLYIIETMSSTKADFL